MARNRRPQASDEKRAEIVTAARRLFTGEGYDATPMNRLAKDAGVAANTLYWYFSDKDDVLIAVLNSVMADIWPQYEEIAAQPIAARLHWMVGQLKQMSRLVTTVHARVEHSPAVSSWHEDFHAITGALFRYELEQAGVSPEAIEAEVMIGIFTIEGLLMHAQDDARERAICEALASRWSVSLNTVADQGL